MNQLRMLWIKLPIEKRVLPSSEEFNSWVQLNLDEWRERERQKILDQKRIEEKKRLLAERDAKEIRYRLEAGENVKDKLNRIGVLDHFYSDSRFQYIAIRFENGVSSYCFPNAFKDGFLTFV